jgi:hypothetical protein
LREEMIYMGSAVLARKVFFKITLAGLLILVSGICICAQTYRGAPVKKDRLIKALRSKQLQTRDIVTIIKSNGVDFALTPKIRESLIEAGARPEVISAIDDNLRLPLTENNSRTNPEDYDDLIDQAIYVYKDKNDPNAAVQFLNAAVKIKPKDPAAFQMLGFVNLYGLKNLPQARKYMRESVTKGGSAVFRVYHDDNGNFKRRCTGSLYISPESIRFESDDNIHTFETSILSVDKVRQDTESTGNWNKYPVFKIFLKIGDSETKFKFAPVSGKTDEAKMVEQLILEAKIS